MKKLFSILIVSISVSMCSISAKDLYASFAKKWCATYIYDECETLRISITDLQAVRGLIQSSADRSASTLSAQEAALDMVTIFWQAWQNLSQTRLNPSHDRPYDVSRAKSLSFDAYWDLIDEQKRISQEYVEIAQRVVHGNVLEHAMAKDAVESMRTQARVYMVEALGDVKKQLGGLYDIAFHKSSELDIDTEGARVDIGRALNIAEFILSYVPNLAMHSFIQADKAHNLMSAEAWQVLEKIQRVSNQVWAAIETARYTFYRALLDELNCRAL